jgi:hypothetical protein
MCRPPTRRHKSEKGRPATGHPQIATKEIEHRKHTGLWDDIQEALALWSWALPVVLLLLLGMWL